jgi:hypothetical protein
MPRLDKNFIDSRFKGVKDKSDVSISYTHEPRVFPDFPHPQVIFPSFDDHRNIRAIAENGTVVPTVSLQDALKKANYCFDEVEILTGYAFRAVSNNVSNLEIAMAWVSTMLYKRAEKNGIHISVVEAEFILTKIRQALAPGL